MAASQSKPSPSRPESENAPLPHVLDLIQHRRTRMLWIAVAHTLVVAVAVGVIWWATQSTGTPRAQASGWPTTNAWPEPAADASGWPEATPAAIPVPPGSEPRDARPEVPADSPLAARPKLSAPTTATSDTPTETPGISDRPSPIIDPPDAEPQGEEHAQASANVEIVPRLVQLPRLEIPEGAGLLETLSEAAPRSETPASASEPGSAIRLPPGGIRPVPEATPTPVEWAEPVDDPSEPSEQAVALTTGQIQVEAPKPEPESEPIQAQASTSVALTPAETTASADPPHTAETPEPEAPERVAADAEPRGPEAEAEPAVAVAPTLPRDLTTGSFYGLSAGRRTVYLLDASGSLLDTLPFAIEELYRSVRTLDARQHYAVVFFNGDGVLEAAPGGMQPASRAHLSETLTWLEPRLDHVRAKGRPDAAAALAHALALQPDTIVLLSDGVTGLRDPAGDRRRLVTLLERLGRGVRVHTVQFIDPDPLAARGRLGTLELLSSLSGGRHRFVGLDQVAPRPRP
ncbi:MAG: hypothetical protein AAGE65_01105 [Planctomycetota bacterium]